MKTLIILIAAVFFLTNCKPKNRAEEFDQMGYEGFVITDTVDFSSAGARKTLHDMNFVALKGLSDTSLIAKIWDEATDGNGQDQIFIHTDGKKYSLGDTLLARPENVRFNHIYVDSILKHK